jgi:hypothetical protein
MECKHLKVECLSPYEIIRKYKCLECGEVMMCSCEEEFAIKCLPHQISEGTVLKTKERVPVTLGFEPLVCNSCRGVPEEACPKAPMHGSTSKITRYYWREIQISTIHRFVDWTEQQGIPGGILTIATHQDEYKKCRRQAIAEAKELHKRNPKYTYNDQSQSEVIEEFQVQELKFSAEHIHNKGERLLLRRGEQQLRPEEFVAQEFREQGYQVLFTESCPFHVLFGTLMWLLIQDPEDPKNKMVGFGDRFAHEQNQPCKNILTLKPDDFGSPGYAERRKDAIQRHLSSLPRDREGLLWSFDYWTEPSANLRQYLWAHRTEDVEKAKAIISILPPNDLIRILEYLVGDYWGRYCGWPDLLAYTDMEFCFIEVKSSKDKLSEDQKNWIHGNAQFLKFPFKIAKIHNSTS